MCPCAGPRSAAAVWRALADLYIQVCLSGMAGYVHRVVAEELAGALRSQLGHGDERGQDPRHRPSDPDGFRCHCGRRLPWPSETADATCECGTNWETDDVGGARIIDPIGATAPEAEGASTPRRVKPDN
jgi:hypothetical protein